MIETAPAGGAIQGKMALAVTPFVLFVPLRSDILSQPPVTDEPAFSPGNPPRPRTAATSPLCPHGLPGCSGRRQSARFVQPIRPHGAEGVKMSHVLFFCPPNSPFSRLSLLRWPLWESCGSRESLLFTAWVTDKSRSSLEGQFLLRTLNHKLGTLNTRARVHGNLAPRLAA